MGKVIHYIGEEWSSKFIVAETLCKRGWDEVDEFTSDKKYVSCKTCLKKIK